MNKVKTMLVAALGLATISLFPSQAQARGIYGSINTQAVVLNNFATRQAQLRSEIAADVSNGTLSPMVASSLTSELDSINAQAQSAMAFGRLNDFQIAQMTNLFNDVSSKLDASVASNPFGVSPYGSMQAAYGYSTPVYRNQLWRDMRHDVRDMAWRPERDFNRNFNRNWQFDRHFDRRFEGRVDRQPVADHQFEHDRVANLPHDNVRFDEHRR